MGLRAAHRKDDPTPNLFPASLSRASFPPDVGLNYPPPASEPPPPPKPPTTPVTDSLSKLVAEHPDEIVKVAKGIGDIFDSYTSSREKHYRLVLAGQAKAVSRLIQVVLAVVSLVVVATAFLTYKGDLSGEAFAFVAGTVVGSLIAFLAEHIAPNLIAEEPSDN